MRLLLLFAVLFAACAPPVQQQVLRSYRLHFPVIPPAKPGDDLDWSRQQFRREFTIKSAQSTKYAIEIVSDSTCLLYQFRSPDWQLRDTISYMFMMLDSNSVDLPGFIIDDFDQDSTQDLICWTGTNMNGNRWEQIYLSNPATGVLEKLYNRAEGAYIWDAPEYEPKDSTIHCTRVSGVYGLSFTSTYKLKDHKAIPVEKKEEDNTGVGMDGKGGLIRYYAGQNGVWKLLKTVEKSAEE